MGRKKKHEEHVNHERWLVSYADFITLLFAFFTSMYAISTVDAKKAGQMVFSTRAAFNLDFFPSDKPVLGMSSPEDPPPVDSVKTPREKIIPETPKPKKKGRTIEIRSSRGIQSVARELNDFIAAKKLSQQIQVRVRGTGLIVSLGEAAFFDPGQADIKSTSLEVFDAISEKILQTGHPIRVEGHTDDSQVRGGKFDSNWELSAARAVRVVRYLSEEFAYPDSLMSIAGYAAYQPIADNNTKEGRAQNRRVDLVILGMAPDKKSASASDSPAPATSHPQ